MSNPNPRREAENAVRMIASTEHTSFLLKKLIKDDSKDKKLTLQIFAFFGEMLSPFSHLQDTNELCPLMIEWAYSPKVKTTFELSQEMQKVENAKCKLMEVIASWIKVTYDGPDNEGWYTATAINPQTGRPLLYNSGKKIGKPIRDKYRPI